MGRETSEGRGGEEEGERKWVTNDWGRDVISGKGRVRFGGKKRLHLRLVNSSGLAGNLHVVSIMHY